MRAIHRLGVLVIVLCLVLVSCDVGDDGADEAVGCGQSGYPVKLRYRVESTPAAPGTFAETVEAVCGRLSRLGLGRVEVRRAGHELEVRTPRRLAAAVESALEPGRLHVLDWEPNVLGPAGPDSPFSGATALFEAVEAASRMRPRAEPEDAVPGVPTTPEDADLRNDGTGQRHYLFGPDRRLLAGPAANRGAFATVRVRGARVLKVPQGIVVAADGHSRARPGTPSRYFVLEDDPELSRADIEGPRAGADSRSREPIVTFGFTERGRMAFAALTRRVAQRGAAAAGPDSDAAVQRVAIALDDTIVTLASIDFRKLPEGMDGKTGAQIDGIGSRRRARQVAGLLRAPLLPANLVPLGRR